jgi:hypothetical protein
MPIVHLIAALAQEVADHVLARPLRAAGRGDGDEIARGRELCVEAGIDGIEDSLLGIAEVHRTTFPVARGSNHNFTGDCRYFAPPFRIANAHLHCEKAHHAAFLRSRSHAMTNNRNVLYLIIGMLVVALGVVGYNLYQAKKEPEGVQINVGPNGLKIQSK